MKHCEYCLCRLAIFFKQSSLAERIRKNLAKLGKLKFIAVSKKLAKREKIPESEIYLLFVGMVPAAEVKRIMDVEQKNYPFEINYTVMTEDEFKFRKKNNDPFIWTFLKKPKIMIVGTQEALLS